MKRVSFLLTFMAFTDARRFHFVVTHSAGFRSASFARAPRCCGGSNIHATSPRRARNRASCKSMMVIGMALSISRRRRAFAKNLFIVCGLRRLRRRRNPARIHSLLIHM